MKRIFLLSFLLIGTFLIQAQTKYLIYFKDKGVSPNNSLQKSSTLFQLAEKEISQRAIERRKQVMGEDNYITYEDIPLNENYVNQIEKLGIKIINKLKWFNAVSAYLTDGQLNSIKTLSSILKIEKVRVFNSRNDENQLNGSSTNNPNRLLSKTTSTTGLDYGGSFTQNNLSDIPTVHDLGIKGTGVYIGILDDGFSYRTYNSLKNLKVIREYDYVHQSNTVSNQGGHGSSVFCLMAGFDPGNAIGPAYDAKFFLAETENDASETHAEEDNYAAALQDMESAGVDITSSSLGYNIFDNNQTSYSYHDMNGTTTIVAKAANLAFERGLTSFTAAGNDGSSFWGPGNGGLGSPGDALNIITVGAVDASNNLASFSSRGPTSDGRIKPEIVAMGQGNYVASTSGTSYGYGNGTSFSTPIAAGIAALLKSCWPHLTNVQIRKIFLECGDNSGSPNNNKGWGLISAKRVINYPNFGKRNNVLNLNKIFENPYSIKSSTVTLNYKINGSILQSEKMSFDGNFKYNKLLYNLSKGDKIEYYFTFEKIDGTLVTEPKLGFYNENINYNVLEEKDNLLPNNFILFQNFPNPFNSSTQIIYQISSTSSVLLKVYDVLGREVATLVDKEQSSGTYHSQFPNRNSQLPSGVYFYRLQAGDFSETKKMILLK